MMVSAVRLSREAVGCRSAGRQRRQRAREEEEEVEEERARRGSGSGRFEGEEGGESDAEREERVWRREGGHWGGGEVGRVVMYCPCR